jgi:hypothetical protein
VIVHRRPVADREPREVRASERGRLGDRGPHDRYAEQVRLELHQRVVGGGAAVHAQFGQRDPGVGRHRVEQIGHLIGDALERRARDVSRRRPARDADDYAAYVRIPMRRAEAGERRD